MSDKSLDQISREEHKKWAVKYTSQNTNNKTSPSGTSSLGIVPWDASWDACRKAMEEQIKKERQKTFEAVVLILESPLPGFSKSPIEMIKNNCWNDARAMLARSYFTGSPALDSLAQQVKVLEAQELELVKIINKGIALAKEVKENYPAPPGEIDDFMDAANRYFRSISLKTKASRGVVDRTIG